jgi:hypothetical protein
MEAHTYGRSVSAPSAGRRLATETKQAFKTTEFWVYIAVVLGILIAGLVTDGGDAASTSDGDGFGADKVWLYITLASIGYMISRGFAKAGSRDPYWDTPDAGTSGEGLGERVKAAAQVIKDGPDAAQGGSNHRSETETHRI